MPVVVVASSKGGAGKSTTAVLLGTELAHKGRARNHAGLRPQPFFEHMGREGEAPGRHHRA